MLGYPLQDFNIAVQYIQAIAGIGRDLLPGHNLLLLQQICRNLYQYRKSQSERVFFTVYITGTWVYSVLSHFQHSFTQILKMHPCRRYNAATLECHITRTRQGTLLGHSSKPQMGKPGQVWLVAGCIAMLNLTIKTIFVQRLIIISTQMYICFYNGDPKRCIRQNKLILIDQGFHSMKQFPS